MAIEKINLDYVDCKVTLHFYEVSAGLFLYGYEDISDYMKHSAAPLKHSMFLNTLNFFTKSTILFLSFYSNYTNSTFHSNIFKYYTNNFKYLTFPAGYSSFSIFNSSDKLNKPVLITFFLFLSNLLKIILKRVTIMPA